MPNPLNQLNNYNNMPGMGNIQQMYQSFMNSKNPMQLFQQMAMKNPQLNNVVKMINSGGNPQQVFNQLCQQRGINPDTFINTIRNGNNIH